MGMNYHSTRNKSLVVSDAQAILQGLAPDGGLFVPETIPTCAFSSWQDLSFAEVAERIFALYFPSLGKERIAQIVKKAYKDRFRDPDVCPVRLMSDRRALLELWHGPTLAFKDVALSTLPHLMRAAQEVVGDHERVLILTATSGDTGKAAMEGFSGVPGFGVLVFYPADGVSDAQERQMCTTEDDNVFAYAVEGDFDDCQRAVKRMFQDDALTKTLKSSGIRLSSANSINIGRLVPQMVYYITAYHALVKKGELAYGDLLDVSVPTGNFGDLLAGYYVKRMGLPLGTLVVASNSNHVLSDFGRTGVYDSNRPLILTTSPSMDILISSNLERFLYHELGSTETVKTLMDALQNERRFVFPSKKDGQEKRTDDPSFEAIEGLYWAFAEENAVRHTIAETAKRDHIVIDPHTACGVAVYEMYRNETEEKDAWPYGLILSTASPYKFTNTVLSALDRDVPKTLEEQWTALSCISHTSVPAPFLRLAERKARQPERISLQEVKDAVLSFAKGV